MEQNMSFKQISFLLILSYGYFTFSMEDPMQDMSYIEGMDSQEDQLGKSDLDNEFMLAVAMDDFQEVERLLKDEKVNPNLRDKRGLTPLMVAVIKCSRGSIKLLIEAGAIVNEISTGERFYNGCSPLTVAVYTDKLGDIAYNLIQYGADVNFRLGGGKTIFMLAVEQFNYGLMDVLIATETANNSAQDDQGLTVYDHINQMIKSCIDKGPDYRSGVINILNIVKGNICKVCDNKMDNGDAVITQCCDNAIHRVCSIKIAKLKTCPHCYRLLRCC